MSYEPKVQVGRTVANSDGSSDNKCNGYSCSQEISHPDTGTRQNLTNFLFYIKNLNLNPKD